MKHDLYRLTKGEVELAAEGPHGERLLNLALQQGMDIRDIRRTDDRTLTFRLSVAELRQLRLLTRSAHCRLRIRKRRGLPFVLHFLHRRPLLLPAAALAVLALCFVCSLIFTVEVTSPYALSPADAERVRSIAAEAGIRPGASRWWADPEAAEEAILNEFRQLYYAEIYEHGVHLQIHVAKRVDVPPEEQALQPGDVVANCHAVIRDVLVKSGTAAVKSGDVVAPGDVLIYGWFAGAPTAALGIVTASVYAEAYGECAEQQTVQEETGHTVQAVGLQSKGGSPLWLLGSRSHSYAASRTETTTQTVHIWRKTPLPVEILYNCIYELQSRTITYTPQQAQTLAEQAARQEAEARLAALEGVEIFSTEMVYEHLYLADGIRRTHAVLTALAEIGAYRPLTEEELQARSAQQQETQLQQEAP